MRRQRGRNADRRGPCAGVRRAGRPPPGPHACEPVAGAAARTATSGEPARTSSISAVLPMPAGPATSTRQPRPSAARAAASASTARIASRPMSPAAAIALDYAAPTVREGSAMATIVFFPEGAYGPTNNCVGIGDVLRERGHRVVFIVEESFAGTLEAKGFEERLMRLGPPPEETGGAGPVLEGLHPRDGARLPQDHPGADRGVHRAHLAGAHRRRPLRRRAADGDPRRAPARRDRRRQRRRLSRPSRRAAAPGYGSSRATRSSSGTRLPPAFSGYPVGDPATGTRSGTSTARVHGDMPADFDAFSIERGAPPLPASEFIHDSPWLNLYVYPAEADYGRARPLARPGTAWSPACARPTRPGSRPTTLRDRRGKLVYLSASAHSAPPTSRSCSAWSTARRAPTA